MQKYKIFYSYPNLFELFFQLFQNKDNTYLITNLLPYTTSTKKKFSLHTKNLFEQIFLEVKDFIENERIKIPINKIIRIFVLLT